MNTFKLNTIIFFFAVCFFISICKSNPILRVEDKIRIKEAIKISQTYGDSIWSEFNKPAFAIILVTDQYEFLINHPYPSDDFQLIGKDEVLQTNVYFREQHFNKGFLATFPAVNGVNCIVIGTPENTGINSTQWIITLLHERFHQYQYTSPNYHDDALSLGLSDGDKTGMWQLNYPFPYEDSIVNQQYEKYTKFLIHAVKSRGKEDWKKSYEEYMSLRNDFKESLTEQDYKYLSFQWYQEGVARFTEYAFLQLLKNHEPSKEVLKLDDLVPYDFYEKEFFKRHIDNVVDMKLTKSKRVTVYDVGFAEALIIEKINPNWRRKYLTEKFDLAQLHQ